MRDNSKNKYRLLREASNASSLQEIADIAYQLLGNPIFIEDRSAIKLAFTRGIKVNDERWEDGVVNKRIILPKNDQVKEVLETYKRSSETGLPVIVHDSFMEGPRLVKTLYYNGEHIGNIVSPGYFKEFTDEDIDIVEILAGFVCRFLVGERYPIEQNTSHSLESLFFQMLRGENFPDELISEYTKAFNWGEDTVHYIFNIFPRNEVKKGEIPLSELIERIRNAAKCQCIFFDMHIVCLVHADSDFDIEDPQSIPLTQMLEKYDLVAGISHPFKDLNLCEPYARQALSMANLGAILNLGEYYYHYDKFACYHMMDLVESEHPLAQFCHHKILDLVRYDEENNTEFTRTLHIYLESSRSISHTAQMLFMHKNTVTYRVNKCFELLGTKIENNDELFSFLFSLRILEYMKMRTRAKPRSFKEQEALDERSIAKRSAKKGKAD